MTGQERADITVLKDQMKRANEDITEIKGDVKSLVTEIGNLPDKLDQRYITRKEMNVGKWMIGLLVALAAAIGAVIGGLRL